MTFEHAGALGNERIVSAALDPTLRLALIRGLRGPLGDEGAEAGLGVNETFSSQTLENLLSGRSSDPELGSDLDD
ncbi:hypothetical protein ACFV7R_17650 [Streptomyces sp. NPDC059866]|uniref:hypothetical protein n=1 Tax=Streptomyces sp. NPDC059866 TaxID=3346978 RepID=UPI003647E29C